MSSLESARINTDDWAWPTNQSAKHRVFNRCCDKRPTIVMSVNTAVKDKFDAAVKVSKWYSGHLILWFCWTGTSINHTELRLATVKIDTFEKKSIARKTICIWPLAKISFMQLRTLEHVLQLFYHYLQYFWWKGSKASDGRYLIKKERNIKISLCPGTIGADPANGLLLIWWRFRETARFHGRSDVTKSFYQNRCKSLIWIFFWWGRICGCFCD